MREYDSHPVTRMLDSGNCEPLKAMVHGAMLALAALCAAYNAAAWLRRRQVHLAINATLYGAVVCWERCHVVHHLTACPHEPQDDAAPLTDAA